MNHIHKLFILYTAILQTPFLMANAAEPLNVDAIKKKYWAKGNESELGVVQNRLFSKAQKFQLGLLGGIIYSDPFLDVKAAGASVGYNFNEFFGLSVIAWKDFVSPSSALTTFREKSGGDANTNEAKYYFGSEAAFSMLYGKLSLLGKSIVYYDMHLLGGVGMTDTESGRYITPSAGIGQRFFLGHESNNVACLRFDYRLMMYREKILEKVVPANRGQDRGDRNNFSNALMLSFEFLFSLK